MTAIRTVIVCCALTGLAMPARAAPPDGKWTGEISCAKLSFTKGVAKVPMDLTVSDGKAAYRREVMNADGSRIVGTEEGTGTVTSDGAISLTATWKSATEGARYNYTASYSGKLSDGQGTLSGTQIWSFDGKTENRSCSIALKR
jgi:osmotically-inducible protein OsmY